MRSFPCTLVCKRFAAASSRFLLSCPESVCRFAAFLSSPSVTLGNHATMRPGKTRSRGASGVRATSTAPRANVFFPPYLLSELVPNCSGLFDHIFVSPTSPLRSLFNLELFTALEEQTVRGGQQESDQTRQIREEMWPRVCAERRQGIEAFRERLKEIEDDPNEKVESFFVPRHLMETIFKSPFFYTHSVLDSILSIASIPELGDPKLALRINLRGLAAVQRLFGESPLTTLSPEVAKQLKLYKSVGAQDVLRQSFLGRLSTVIRLSCLFFTRHFDSYADLIPSPRLALIRQQMVQTLFPADGRSLLRAAGQPTDLDAHGFSTALALLSLSEELRTPVQYLDERNRLFVVSCSSCSGERQSFLATADGLVPVPGDALAPESSRLPLVPPAHEFPGLQIWEAPKASVVGKCCIASFQESGSVSSSARGTPVPPCHSQLLPKRLLARHRLANTNEPGSRRYPYPSSRPMIRQWNGGCSENNLPPRPDNSQC